MVARLLSPKLGEKLGQPIIIENKPGGAGDFAAEMMLQAPADGYTLMMTTVAVHAINPGLYKTRKFDPINDFTPIALVCSYPMIMIAAPSTTFKTPAELKELAAKTPTFYSSSGVGSPGHLAGELLVKSLGANITHVPYKGGSPSVVAIMSNEAQVNFATLPAVVPQIRGGKVRAIGLASRARNPAVPDVPTMAELGIPDFEVGTWSGLIGPRGVPAEVVQKINAAVSAVVNDPVVKQRLLEEGAEIKLHVARRVRQVHARRERALGESRPRRGNHAPIKWCQVQRPNPGAGQHPPRGSSPSPIRSSPASRCRDDRRRW